jgi:multidrug efflux pump subunit AcrA (membrane-fusion protein)
MKVMKIFLAVVLLVSLGLNLWFWQERAVQLASTEVARAGAVEAAALRAENEASKIPNLARPTPPEVDALELARLRSEVGQLRKRTAETELFRAQAAEAGSLRAQLNAAKKNLAAAEENLAEAVKLTPEQLLALKGEAQATACINNMKQIGLAVLLYANYHEKVFPPDLPALKIELVTPKVLFCPAAPGGVQATEWAQLNPGAISYQLLNPNGNNGDPQKPLTACPIHGHFGLSDGSVHRGNR